MRKIYFAITMGLVRQEPNHSFPLQASSVYHDLLRKVSLEFLNSGARIYLPFPVELLKSEADIHNIIADSGYCLMSFEQPMSKVQVSLDCKAIVRQYGLELISKLDNVSSEDYLEAFVLCFSPYLVSFSTDQSSPQSEVLSRALDALNDVIVAGKKLSTHTQGVIIELLRRLYAAKAIR